MPRIQTGASNAFACRDATSRPFFNGKEPKNMGIGVTLILVAAGAILIWAVNTTVNGIELHTIGWILLVVGAVGALLSLIFWSGWGVAGAPGGGRRTVVRDDY